MEMILAVNNLNGIGYKNALPWEKVPEDMRHFVNVTKGKTVLMGRSTYESIGSVPLPNRKNIVLSTTLKDSKVTVIKDLNDLEDNDVIVLGGLSLYEQLLDKCTVVYLTYIHQDNPVDTVLSDEFMNKLQAMNHELITSNSNCTIYKLTRSSSEAL